MELQQKLARKIKNEAFTVLFGAKNVYHLAQIPQKLQL